MALFGVIMGGLSIVSGVVGANKSKKQADKQAKIQKQKVEAQYQHNKKEVENTFFNNAETNFYNIADNMFSLTKDYITKNSEASFNASILSGGAVFNSSRNDIKNALKINYMDAMTQLTSERAYNERTLYNNSINALAQLDIDRQAELNGIHNAKAQAHAQANQNIINSVTSGVSSIYSAFSGGLETHTGDTTGEGSSLTRALKSKKGSKGLKK